MNNKKNNSKVNPYLLRDWSLICTTRDLIYKAPELYEYSLQGKVYNNYKFLNDTNITTSYIKNIDGLYIETISNSIYKLDGLPNKNYIDYCKEKNIVIDNDNPIKFIKL